MQQVALHDRFEILDPGVTLRTRACAEEQDLPFCSECELAVLQPAAILFVGKPLVHRQHVIQRLRNGVARVSRGSGQSA